MESKHFCLYPIYMDSARSLSEGRKYRKEICVQRPRYHEIKNALEKLEIEYTDEPSKKHPRDFFNSGRFRIKKEYGRLFVIEGISQTIAELRSKPGSSEETSREKQSRGKAVHGVVQNGVYVENKLNLVRKKKAKKKK
ncbi:SIGNAL RECOGNITION PARTICLE (SRP) SEC65 SUBUNIT [Encephalitozoon cuniculi GB-M1]|uniref:Signal recognition particle SEC65 subunit n=2 Tax=Encephalitozoon cuniculi TaxID=6035 RepID=SEC65_ENCCU|nr:signal recognition particle protein Srp19 [Encephalitozoon cuniculi GB-M1]Q8SRC3.1 RecName: Full=Signal recognition particle SEC65 subunit [Encephalitozoon cuniculi GB-M1]AGE95172.1 signal recognition particle sec65 subunit [Encephalitozoon cuniculi]KMV65609.1 signal recognition particle protein Srp19 [Encephalitozoon cuniculi EcunIII-L]UYI27011.1 signal recognition particle SEC65 subunit [Encephalitozoon cuniculi]CAD26386.1 SIGNAL RECOGNITION PARTICLE (SRP) SEC65 SUBUNIT [Encephalitozoon c